jgi:hypothetical protein
VLAQLVSEVGSALGEQPAEADDAAAPQVLVRVRREPSHEAGVAHVAACSADRYSSRRVTRPG